MCVCAFHLKQCEYRDTTAETKSNSVPYPKKSRQAARKNRIGVTTQMKGQRERREENLTEAATPANIVEQKKEHLHTAPALVNTGSGTYRKSYERSWGWIHIYYLVHEENKECTSQCNDRALRLMFVFRPSLPSDNRTSSRPTTMHRAPTKRHSNTRTSSSPCDPPIIILSETMRIISLVVKYLIRCLLCLDLLGEKLSRLLASPGCSARDLSGLFGGDAAAYLY